MAFRNAATVVVALVFKLLDTSGFTRFLLSAKTRLGIAGYAIVYDDPDFENATTEAGVWASGQASGAGPGTDVAQIQLYADITNIVNLMGYVEANVIESLQESGLTLMTLAPGGEQASITLSARNAGISEISIVCERMGPWIGVAGGVGFAANFADNGGGDQVCQYRKVGDEIQIRGVAVSTGATGAGATIFTLPVGFRPPATQSYKTAIGGFAPEVVQVRANGLVVCIPALPGAGTTVYLPLTCYSSA
jgi:hypothetical protein